MADDSWYGDQFGSTPSSIQVSNLVEDNKHSAVKYDHTQALRSVTIRQVLEAQQPHTSASFQIEGKQVRKVTLVAEVIVLNTSQPTCDVFHLEDGSRGRLIARVWNNESSLEDHVDVSSKRGVDISEHVYVRVIGTISRFNERNSVIIDDIRRVQDPHELYYHTLQTIVDTLTYERGPPPNQLVPTNFSDRSQSARVTQSVQDLSGSFSASLSISDSPQSRQPDSPRLQTQNVCVESASNQDTDSDGASPVSTVSRDSYATAQSEPNNSLDSEVLDRTLQPLDSPTPLNALHLKFSLKPEPLDRSGEVSDTSTSHSMIELSGTSRPASRPRPSISRDPYSELTTLQRSIILFILDSVQPRSIYPGNSPQGHTPGWEGVNIGTIFTALSVRPQFTAEDFEEAITTLLEEAYIYKTIDDAHLAVTSD